MTSSTIHKLHHVSNGMLFRSDVHMLFDRGYVTVTPDHRFEVSRRIREEFENGKDYYAFQGHAVRLPSLESPYPDPELLRWHSDNVFRG
jgi:putative restriction endonuclease